MKYGFLPKIMWGLFHKSYKNALITVLHQENPEVIMKKSHHLYKSILKDIDEFDKGDRFLFNILSCAMFSAVYLSLPNKPDADMMETYYSTAMDTWVIHASAKKSKAFTVKGRDKLKRSAKWSQNCSNPYSWKFIVEDGANINEYTATFTTCGILYLMKKLGISEVTPAMCHFDYDMAAMNHTEFTRKYTLASGGSVCDCHYCHHDV